MCAFGFEPHPEWVGFGGVVEKQQSPDLRSEEYPAAEYLGTAYDEIHFVIYS